MPGVQDVLMALTGGGGAPGGMPPMPPGPPGMGGPLPTVGSADELGKRLADLGTEIGMIGSQLMQRGQMDAAISCGKAVKELEKIPDLLQRGQQAGGIPPMGAGMGMSPMGPPMMPGMTG